MPRAKEFDRTEVLEQAMKVFWQAGYADTSMQDLVEHMGINRFSIYEAFGSKHALFVEALEHYQSKLVWPSFAALESRDSSLADIRRFFDGLLEMSKSERADWGCLLCNTAAELSEDSEAVESVSRYIERATRAFARALSNAKKRGELPPEFKVRPYARYLVGVILGFSVYIKTIVDRAAVADYVRMALAAIR